MPDLIPVDQAANEFDVGRNTLFRHLRNGRLNRYKGGIGDPQTYVDRSELRRLVKPMSAYVGEISVVPPNDQKSQPVIHLLARLGVPSHALRARPELNNAYSFRFPYKVWASNRRDAIERLRQVAADEVVEVLQGHRLKPETVRIEIDPDSVHGPSLG